MRNIYDGIVKAHPDEGTVFVSICFFASKRTYGKNASKTTFWTWGHDWGHDTSVPWWNIAMSIWRLNSCKTQAWNDNSNTLILDTYNWPVKVLVKPHKLSCKTILKGRFRLIRTSGRKNSHTNSYNSAMSLIHKMIISQLELGQPVFNLYFVLTAS